MSCGADYAYLTDLVAPKAQEDAATPDMVEIDEYHSDKEESSDGGTSASEKEETGPPVPHR